MDRECKKQNGTVTKRDIQERLLPMLKKFHEVCEEHHIRYYMNSGTMLGAIRHKGFIPWDDDVDLGLFREEYDRLLKLPASVWGEDYQLAHFQNKKGYPYCFAKLYDKRTTVIEDGYVKYRGGVYLDIFPHDGAGNTEKTAHLRYWSNFARYWLLIYNLLEEKKAFPKSILQKWAKSRSTYAWQKRLDEALREKSCKDCRYVANFIGRHRTKEVFDKELFGTPVLYPFEDLMLYGPEKYDEYLTQLYGNYMELPSEEEQEANHPNSYVNLSEGF